MRTKEFVEAPVGGMIEGPNGPELLVPIGECHSCSLPVAALYNLQGQATGGVVHQAPACAIFDALDPDVFVHEMARARGVADPDLPTDFN